MWSVTNVYKFNFQVSVVTSYFEILICMQQGATIRKTLESMNLNMLHTLYSWCIPHSEEDFKKQFIVYITLESSRLYLNLRTFFIKKRNTLIRHGKFLGYAWCHISAIANWSYNICILHFVCLYNSDYAICVHVVRCSYIFKVNPRGLKCTIILFIYHVKCTIYTF